MRLKLWWFLVLGSLVLNGACAKRLMISYKQVEVENELRVRLKSGKTIQGSVKEKGSDSMTLVSEENDSLHTVRQEEILKIERKPPVYDEGGKIISEREIKQFKKNKNLLLFSIGGGGMSFGVSFFLGSILHRSLAENKDAALWITTGVGTLMGTSFFVFKGNKKDRTDAIELIKKNTRRFAKNQRTWFKTFKNVHWLDIEPDESPEKILNRTRALLNEISA